MREAFGAPTAGSQLDRRPDDIGDFEQPEMGAEDMSRFSDPEVEAEAGPSFAESARNTLENTRQTLSTFGERAKAFFGGMSERGKEVAQTLYEGVYKTPGVQRLAGKMEIAYNQFFVDRHEGKAINLRDQATSLSPRIEAVDLAAKETAAAIETLRSMGAPGLAGLERKALDFDQQKLDLLLNQKSLNQQADSRVGRMEQFKGKRDLIADRLIDIYGEKMSPIKEQLDSLGGNLQLAETQAELTREEHEQQLRDLTGLEGRRDKIAKLLGATGLSEKDVERHEVVNLIDKQIAAGREKVRVEDERMKRTLITLNGRVASTSQRVDGYRNRQQEFENLKRNTLTSEQLGVTSRPEDIDSDNDTEKNEAEESPFDSEAEENSVEATLKKLSVYLEDNRDGSATKEQKEKLLKDLLEADPKILTCFQDMFDENVTNEEREQLVETLNKAEHRLGYGQKGFDIRLPGKGRTTLVVERTKEGRLTTRILKQAI